MIFQFDQCRNEIFKKNEAYFLNLSTNTRADFVYMFHWSGMCHVTHFKDGFSIFKWPSYRNRILFVLILSISLWCLLPMMCADHKIRLPKEMNAENGNSISNNVCR